MDREEAGAAGLSAPESRAAFGSPVLRRPGKMRCSGAGLPPGRGVRAGRRGRRLSLPLSASVVPLALKPFHHPHQVLVAALVNAL